MSRFLLLLVALAFLNCAQGSAISALLDHHEEEHHDDGPPPALRVQNELEKNIITNLSNNAAYRSLRPVGKGADGVTEIKVNAHIRDIRIVKVDTGLYEWTANLILRQFWNDQRMTYDSSHFPDYKYFHTNDPGAVRGIWKADLFFRNGIKSDFHFVLTPNVLLWFYPDGNITYSLRLTVTHRCAQPDEKDDARKELVCPFDLASYGYTSDKVHFTWDNNLIQVSENLHIPHYTIGEVTHEESLSTSRIGTFSGLQAKFHFVPN